jgi:hypothetical protein
MAMFAMSVSIYKYTKSVLSVPVVLLNIVGTKFEQVGHCSEEKLQSLCNLNPFPVLHLAYFLRQFFRNKNIIS